MEQNAIVILNSILKLQRDQERIISLWVCVERCRWNLSDVIYGAVGCMNTAISSRLYALINGGFTSKNNLMHVIF